MAAENDLTAQTLSIEAFADEGAAVTRLAAIKRVMDVALGLPLLLASVPVLAVAAVAIWSISRGPVFFVQERVGMHGRRIRIWKLRTMYVDAESRLHEYLQADPLAMQEWERQFKLSQDPRVLPWVGRFLRMTSLDELPQVWNILRGEMSLVGPRPLPAYHLQACPAGFLQLRQSVRPGLTGLWQVQARHSGSLGDLELWDTQYIRQWSLWLDVCVMVKTIPAALIYRRGV